MPYYSKTDDISFTPITLQQEAELFRQFYAGSVEARDELIKQHLRLVAKLALRAAAGRMEEEDSISAGNRALIKTLESKKFDPSRGYRFGSYLRTYVWGEVMQEFRTRGWRAAHAESETDDMRDCVSAEQFGENTLTGRLADQDVAPYKRKLANFVTFVAPGLRFRQDHDAVIQYQTDTANKARREEIERCLGTLPEREAGCIRSVFFAGKNFADVGREQGLTREGVRKCYNRGMAKLKELLESLKPELQ